MENLTPKNLIDNGICPTCYDKDNNNCLYGDNKDKMLYENNLFECFLAGNPRAVGHTIISSKKHYKDMMEIPNDLCQEVFIFAKRLMNILKNVYSAESIYLCTMCDGPMNHFHVQLIPRYSFEERGSKNFVKKRGPYIEDNKKINEIRNLLGKDFIETKRKILVASNNKGKIKEIKDIFNEFDIITMKEMEEKLGKKLEIKEDSDSFSNNALQKAIELVKQINENIIVIGDDSGLSIDALNGFPGIHTQRWMNADDHIKNLALLEKMKDVPDGKRECHYTTAIAVADKNIHNVVEYSLDGTLTKEVIGNNGFGFDEIFKLDTGKTLAEITKEEKYAISPRKKALERIKKFLV